MVQLGSMISYDSVRDVVMAPSILAVDMELSTWTAIRHSPVVEFLPFSGLRETNPNRALLWFL